MNPQYSPVICYIAVDNGNWSIWFHDLPIEHGDFSILTVLYVTA